MQCLRKVLGGDDKAAMWSALDRIGLSPKDSPYVGGGKYVEVGLEESRFFSEDGSSVRDFVAEQNYAPAVAALSYDTAREFQEEYERITAATSAAAADRNDSSVIKGQVAACEQKLTAIEQELSDTKQELSDTKQELAATNKKLDRIIAALKSASISVWRCWRIVS